MHFVVSLFPKIAESKCLDYCKKLETILREYNMGVFKVENTVVNLSDVELTQNEHNVLKFGLNHGIKRKIKLQDLQHYIEE